MAHVNKDEKALVTAGGFLAPERSNGRRAEVEKRIKGKERPNCA